MLLVVNQDKKQKIKMLEFNGIQWDSTKNVKNSSRYTIYSLKLEYKIKKFRLWWRII